VTGFLTFALNIAHHPDILSVVCARRGAPRASWAQIAAPAGAAPAPPPPGQAPESGTTVTI
jgi:hypothetical protein